MQWRQGMAGPRRPVGMLGLRRADFGDGRDDFPGHANSLAGVVPRHVVIGNAKECRQRAGIAAGAGPEEL